MNLSRRSRLATALLVLVSLLFMQFALASYRCPLMAPGAFDAARAAEDPVQVLTPCEQAMRSAVMDAEQPNLCKAHCQAEDQMQPGQNLALSVVAMISASTFTIDPVTLEERIPAPRPPDFSRQIAPTLAVRHCCWRI